MTGEAMIGPQPQKPQPKVFIEEMIFVLNHQAERVENLQVARLIGDARELDAEITRHTFVLRQAASLLAFIELNRDEFRRLYLRVQNGGRRNG